MNKKTLILILTLFLTLFIVGCGGDTHSELGTPDIMIQGNVISWSKVENATSYELCIGDELISLSDTSYTIENLPAGEYKIKVRATIITASKQETGDYSSELTYTSVSATLRIAAPVITITDDLLSWNPVENATYYEVYVGVNKQVVSTTSYVISSDVMSSTSIFVVAGTTIEGFKNSLASNIIKYNKNVGPELVNQVFLDYEDNHELESTFGEVLAMVNERQLYDVALWSRFVEQYRHNSDGDGYGWRGEFWGKMMEGAVLTYRVNKDEKLYKILENTVEDFLTVQQVNGSFSSYGDRSKGHSDEFHGWDMWNRNWALLGLTYFHDICKDDDLKARIVTALTRHLDYICANVGDGEGKININDSASQWGGLPASTMLEVVCKIYNMTKKQEYLDFATHIVDNGGSKYGNQIEQAIAATTLPYTWGAPKAGELCMFFDGVLEYYYITGIEKYKTAAVNYWYLVQESEITIVGGGCSKDECFEHSVHEQSDPTTTHAMQEFCVTIHWLNFTKDIYQLVKDPAIIDSAEITIYNAVMCCVDNEGYYDHVFGSYNNLIYSVRSKSAAGGMSLSYPYSWSYGCCISQGSIATGLIPFYQFAHDTDTFYMNLYIPGTTSTKTPGRNPMGIHVDTEYPVHGDIKATLTLEDAEEFTYALRIPAWSTNTVVKVNGQVQDNVKAGEYYEITRTWSNNDEIEIVLDLRIIEIYGSDQCSNPDGQYNVALRRGPITFARDARLDNGEIFDTVDFVRDNNGEVAYTLSNTATFYNMVEIEVQLTNGKKIHLVNYGHSGKTYSSESMFTTYMPTTDYWKVTFGEDSRIILVNNYFGATMIEDSVDGLIHTSNSIYDYSNLEDFAVQFIEAEDEGYYYVKHIKTGRYLTYVNRPTGTYLEYAEFTGGYNQQYSLSYASLMSHKIHPRNTNYIISSNNEIDAIWLYSDCSSDKQYWTFMVLE